MLNIIKADLYRISRSKGFYITIVLLLLFIGLQTAASSTGVIGVSTDISDADTDGGGGVIMIQDSEENKEQFTGMTAPFELMTVTDNLLYFILPFIIFVGSTDFSVGTAKNVLANGVPRIKYYLAKLILSCIFCTGVLLVNITLPVIVGTIKSGFGGTFGMDFVGKVIRPFAAQLFMCIAVTCVGVFFVFVTKRTAAVNGAYIAFCFIPLLLVFTLNEIFGNLSYLFDYDVPMNIRMLLNIDSASSTDIARAFAIGGFYILASTIGGIAVFRRSEIK
jgi:ABC-2 type transport system permease protein